MRLSLFATQARKFLAAASGAVAQLVAFGLLDGDVEKWVSGILAALTAAAVYLIPNGDTVARETSEGETVAGEASPLPTGTPVEVTPAEDAPHLES